MRHRRATAIASANRDKASIESETDAFYGVFNAIAGTDFSPAKQRQAMMREKFAKYEAILGCKVDSDEFNRRVDATIAAMNKPKV